MHINDSSRVATARDRLTPLLPPRVRRFLGPLLPLAAFFVLLLVFLSASRAALMLWQWQRVSAVDGAWSVLGYGLRMDVSLLCYLLILPAIVALLAPNRGAVGDFGRHLVAVWSALVAGLLVFLEVATPSYIAQYGVRPSRIFLEYLIYPREVLATLWGAYRLQLVAGPLVLLAVFGVAWRAMGHLARVAPRWRWWHRLLVLPLVLLAVFLGARSSLDHRPANPSTAAFSSDPLVNDLALSSAYTLAYAAYSMRHEADAAGAYGTLPREEIIARVRAAAVTAQESFTDASIPTLHRQVATHRRARPLNLVIIVEESLGAQFVGALGGLPLTPELDRLAREGWWFTRLYATGTRSARGLEAVVTGFPPTPAQSVLKLSGAQDGFYTLARTLAERGYLTEFIYGGSAHFDNMNGFFRRNGFARLIDEKDFVDAVYRGSWGVSDEDLFERAHAEFLAHGDGPFFAVVFSSSFHTPFEFPDGRIALHEQPTNTAHNAVKYADYALGRFFRKAKAASYWNDTVFLVVADHDARVHGAALVPVEHFHIPGLILGGTVTPSRYDRPASQIDLAPTLLSLIGVDAEHPMIGHDLTQLPPEYPGRALMQYENNHAYLKGEHVIIHEPHRPARQFRYVDGRLHAVADIDPELEREALAHALWPSLAYRERLYRPPAGAGNSVLVKRRD